MAISTFGANEIVTRGNVNNRITAINNMFPLSIANGGTGGTTKHEARTNLSVLSPWLLYNNTNSGTTGNITFDIPSGYELHDFLYLEFYYSNSADGINSDDGIMMSKVYRWSQDGHNFNNRINLVTTSVSTTDRIYFNIYSVRYSIEIDNGPKGKAIKSDTHRHYAQIDSYGNCSVAPTDNTNNIYVWRVVGYKY